jgi:GntR family transcriptional repressor for pyruvate dehydrogenase complex
MKIQTVKVQRLYLQVADQLRELIRQGTPAPGERLPSERDLAEKFGVARPTIREAMIALEIAGLVQIRSGSGVYVLDPAERPLSSPPDTGPGPFEILEARLLLESEACALAAERLSNKQLRELKRLLKAMEKENLQQNVTEEADQAFHCLIAESTGNSAITGTIEWLWKLRNDSEISTHFHQRLRSEGSRPIIDDHRKILAALEARDPSAARAAMRDHLQRVIDTLLASR